MLYSKVMKKSRLEESNGTLVTNDMENCLIKHVFSSNLPRMIFLCIPSCAYCLGYTGSVFIYTSFIMTKMFNVSISHSIINQLIILFAHFSHEFTKKYSGYPLCHSSSSPTLLDHLLTLKA